jgi:hypothetical protein
VESQKGTLSLRCSLNITERNITITFLNLDILLLLTIPQCEALSSNPVLPKQKTRPKLHNSLGN